MARETNSKCKDWLYTIWFDNVVRYDDWVERLGLYVGDGGSIRFACGQLERCPDTGRLHGQVFVQWRLQQRGTRLGSTTGLIPSDIHWERRRGSSNEARAYCTKEETRVKGPFEFGEMSQQGQRSDLAGACDLIKAGSKLKRVADECPSVYAKYFKGLAALRDVLQTDSNEFVAKDVRLYYGPTGIGKTRRAYAQYPSLLRLPVPGRLGVWFDGYEDDEAVLMDDYGSDSTYPYHMMLQLLDGYPMVVPVKGGFRRWRPKVIIITSNHLPEMWYTNIADISPLLRRITMIVRFIDAETTVIEKETPVHT